MPRVKGGFTARRRHKKLLRAAKGFVAGRRRLYRTARNAVTKAGQYAYRDRRNRKREFRSLWIVRINAACREYGLPYGKFMAGIKRAGVIVDRKNLAVLAAKEPGAFAALVEVAKANQV
jgi:large subunit ribosomal protein L20